MPHDATVSSWLPVVFSGMAAIFVTIALYGMVHAIAQRYRKVYASDTEAGLGEVFLFISAAQVWQTSVAACVAVGALTAWLTGNVYVCVMAAILCMRLPRWLIQRLRTRRLMALESQLPEALRTMAGGLRSGASLAVVIRHVSAHVDAPLSQELELVQREQRVGVSFVEAMQHMEMRLRSESICLLCASLRVAAHTGGNLSETLDSVASTIQRRTQMAARVKTLTAQGRLQALIVGALPVVLLVALSVMAPEDMAPMWHSRAGWVVLAVLAVMETAGLLTIRRIVRVDI